MGAPTGPILGPTEPPLWRPLGGPIGARQGAHGGPPGSPDSLGFLWVPFGAPALRARPHMGSSVGPLRGPLWGPFGALWGPARAVGAANPLGLLQGPLRGACTPCMFFSEAPGNSGKPSGPFWPPF